MGAEKRKAQIKFSGWTDGAGLATNQQTIRQGEEEDIITVAPEGYITDSDTEMMVNADDDTDRMENIQRSAPSECRETGNKDQMDELKTRYWRTIIRKRKWTESREQKRHCKAL